MTFYESLNNLIELQKDYQQFHDDVWQDPKSYGIIAESLKVAIEIMNKYQQEKAHWKPDGKGEMVCSRCNCQRPYFIDYTSEGCKIYGKQTNFCPDCGAKMVDL